MCHSIAATSTGDKKEQDSGYVACGTWHILNHTHLGFARRGLNLFYTTGGMPARTFKRHMIKSMIQQTRTTPSISLKHDQRNILEQWAGEQGISLGAYIRKVALGEIPQKNKALDHRCISQQEFMDLYKEITRIGSNMNQIAKRLHIRYAERKARGEGDFDLSEYPVEDILKFIRVFEQTNKYLANMNRLIMEVVN